MDRRIDGRLVRRFIPVLLIALSLGCEADPTGRYLVMIAALFLLGAVGEVIFARTQIPDVVWLILAGITLNVTGLVDPSALDPILPLFSALTLIIVLFDGGRQIVINDLIKAAPRASAMAVLTFTLSTFGVAVILQLAALTGLLPDSWTFLHSLMVGAMVGGSSSLIIMPSMNLAKVEPKVSNLVGLESALTDALCVVVAVVLMNVIKSGETSGGGAILELGENFGLALIIGLIAGWVWMPVLRGLSGNPYAYPVTLAALMILYVVVDNIGGNPAMAVLTFSVIVGNAEALMKMAGFSLGDKPLALDDTVVTVHTQAAFIIKSFFFTYIGLMLSRPVYLLLLGFVVGLSLFVTRIPVVMLVARKGFTESQRKMITISLPRGMAAGVLATLPASAKYQIAGTEDLPSMVFAAVVTSIAIFAYGFRKVRSETPTGEAETLSDEGVSLPDPATPVSDGMLPADHQLPVSEPVAAAPVASEPVAAAPVASEPVAAAPIASEPVAAAPIASEPVAAAPIATAPAATAPAATAPIASEPVATAPVATVPVATVPVATVPVPPGQMPDGQALRAPEQAPEVMAGQAPEVKASRSGTAYGIAPAPIEPAPKAPIEAEQPISPGAPIVTMHGLPAVAGGPPPPEARREPGTKLPPTSASPSPQPEPPKATRPAPQWQPPQPVNAPAPTDEAPPGSEGDAQ